jgi:hypothetical protein
MATFTFTVTFCNDSIHQKIRVEPAYKRLCMLQFQ